MATTLVRIQLLSKTSTDFATANPVLLDGELGVANAGTSIPVMKIGDGVRPWSALPDIVAAGAGADYVAGPVNTLPAGSPAEVIIDNSVSPPTISFGIPEGGQGDEGPAGPANSLMMGTVTTLPPGQPATATITGTPPDQVLSLGIPSGLPGSMALADPTGLIGLAAVNGVSLLGTRSDARHAIDQGIAPIWTAQHTFTRNSSGPNGDGAVAVAAALPAMSWRATGQAADNRAWLNYVSGLSWIGATINDANTVTSQWIKATRIDNAIANVSFGNATSNPTFTFLGSGTLTWNGSPLLSTAAFANPTASIGLVAVNGVANTVPRSDSAPALSQAIIPTWTNLHKFANAGSNAGALQIAATGFAAMTWNDLSSPANARVWYALGAGSQFRIGALNDALSASTAAITINRTASAITSMVFGNVTDNPSFTFAGTGATSFSSTISTPAANLSSAQPILRFFETDGLTDEKLYDVTVSSGALAFRTRTDSDGVGIAWLQVGRTGTAVGAITLAGTLITLSGFAIANSIRLGSTGGLTAALVCAAGSTTGNAFEWGHTNTAGYRSTLGQLLSNGHQFIAIHGEHGTNANTYRTRGIPASIIESNALGALQFGRAVTANADNQALTIDLTWSATGIFTFNNTVIVGTGTAAQTFAINGPAASNREFYYLTNGSTRWAIRVDAAAESGSNSGSNFVILPISDAGAGLTAAITINRATSNVAIGAALNVGGLITGTTPTQAVGTNNTSLASTAFVQAALPSSAPRTWQVVTPASGVPVTNTTGRDLNISVVAAMPSGGIVNGYISGTQIGTLGVSGSVSAQASFFMVCPPGGTWQVNWSGISSITVYALM